jgi:two-component system, NtrC family, sensor kinase
VPVGARRVVAGGVSKPFRIIGLSLAVLLLLGGWAFLYFKARDVDLRGQNDILGYLRELKEIDTRWNDRVIGVRTADGADKVAAAPPATPVQLAIVQHKLAVQAQALANPVLNQSLAALREAFDQKAKAVDQFWAAHQALRQALAAYNQLAVQGPARGSLATARMSAALANFLTQPGPETTRVAESVAGELEGDLARRGREIVARKTVEERTFREALFVSTGARIDTLTKAFDREFESALQEAEVYRVYLLFYSGFLLAVLALLGARLGGTYQVIQKMNRALRDANEGLEQRVAERTQELSQAMHQLKESEALLIQSEKMSSLGQMVAGVAHEVNTPLAYVKSSLETVGGHMPRLVELHGEADKLLALLQASEPDEAKLAAQFGAVDGLIRELRDQHTLPELESLVQDGLHGIAQISDLVTNLRNFARLDRAKLGDMDLNEGLNSALLIAKNMVKTRTVNKLFGAIPRIHCSASQINQVFLNLITNAAQATPDKGGVITLRTGSKDPSTVFFEVEDNGHGIPEDVLPKIFDPFFTTKEVGEGTGLGLSIVYKIVEQHGGRVAVASKVGVGTRFVVTLPVRALVSGDTNPLTRAAA